jgi:hypothetical protein
VALSPRDADGRWHVLVSHVKPWCTSTWSMIDYSVLRPGATPDAPQVLLDASDSIWWGGDDVGRVHADAHGVDLRYHAASIDTGVHNRVHVRHYEFQGERLRRTPPVAESARDFVDEWIVSDWDAATEWTAAKARVGTRPLHAELHDRRYGLSFGRVGVCPDGRTEVAMDADTEEAPWVFKVAVHGRDYELAGISRKPDARCDRPVPEPVAPDP